VPVESPCGTGLCASTNAGGAAPYSCLPCGIASGGTCCYANGSTFCSGNLTCHGATCM
jgi:hypothetical protein